MSAVALEAFLARLYVDAATRIRFERDPEEEMRCAGLNAEERRSLLDVDPVGLKLAAKSFALKRSQTSLRRNRGLFGGLADRVLAPLSRSRRS